MVGLNPLLATVAKKRNQQILASVSSPQSNALAVIFYHKDPINSISLAICIPWKGLTIFESKLSFLSGYGRDHSKVSLMWHSENKITLSFASSSVWIIDPIFLCKMNDKSFLGSDSSTLHVNEVVNLFGSINLKDQFLFPQEMFIFQPILRQEYSSPGNFIHYLKLPEDLFLVTCDSSFMLLNHDWHAMVDIRIPSDSEHILIRPWQKPEVIYTQPQLLVPTSTQASITPPLSPIMSNNVGSSVDTVVSASATLKKVLFTSKHSRFVSLQHDGSIVIGHLDSFVSPNCSYTSDKMHLVLPVAYSLASSTAASSTAASSTASSPASNSSNSVNKSVSQVYEVCRHTGETFTSINHLTIEDIDKELELTPNVRSKIAKAKGFLTSFRHEEISRIIDIVKLNETKTSVCILALVETRHLQLLEEQQSISGKSETTNTKKYNKPGRYKDISEKNDVNSTQNSDTVVPVTYSLAKLQFVATEAGDEDAAVVSHHHHYSLHCEQVTTLVTLTQPTEVSSSVSCGTLINPQGNDANEVHDTKDRDTVSYDHNNSKYNVNLTCSVSPTQIVFNVSPNNEDIFIVLGDKYNAIRSVRDLSLVQGDFSSRQVSSRVSQECPVAVHCVAGKLIMLHNNVCTKPPGNEENAQNDTLTMRHEVVSTVSVFDYAQSLLASSPYNVNKHLLFDEAEKVLFHRDETVHSEEGKLFEHCMKKEKPFVALAVNRDQFRRVSLPQTLLNHYSNSTSNSNNNNTNIPLTAANLLLQWSDDLRMVSHCVTPPFTLPHTYSVEDEESQSSSPRLGSLPRYLALYPRQTQTNVGNNPNILWIFAANTQRWRPLCLSLGKAGSQAKYLSQTASFSEILQLLEQFPVSKHKNTDVLSKTHKEINAEEGSKLKQEHLWLQKIRYALDLSSQQTVLMNVEVLQSIHNSSQNSQNLGFGNSSSNSGATNKENVHVLQMKWFGCHTLVLLTQRRFQFYLEILSKENVSALSLSIEQQQQGVLAPELHRLVALPPGFQPQLLDLDVFPTQHYLNSTSSNQSMTGTNAFHVQRRSFSQQTCVASVRNETHLLCFQIFAYMTSSSTQQDTPQDTSQINAIKACEYTVMDVFTVNFSDLISPHSKVRQTCLYFPSEAVFESNERRFRNIRRARDRGILNLVSPYLLVLDSRGVLKLCDVLSPQDTANGNLKNAQNDTTARHNKHQRIKFETELISEDVSSFMVLSNSHDYLYSNLIFQSQNSSINDVTQASDSNKNNDSVFQPHTAVLLRHRQRGTEVNFRRKHVRSLLKDVGLYPRFAHKTTSSGESRESVCDTNAIKDWQVTHTTLWQPVTLKLTAHDTPASVSSSAVNSENKEETKTVSSLLLNTLLNSVLDEEQLSDSDNDEEQEEEAKEKETVSKEKSKSVHNREKNKYETVYWRFQLPLIVPDQHANVCSLFSETQSLLFHTTHNVSQYISISIKQLIVLSLFQLSPTILSPFEHHHSNRTRDTDVSHTSLLNEVVATVKSKLPQSHNDIVDETVLKALFLRLLAQRVLSVPATHVSRPKIQSLDSSLHSRTNSNRSLSQLLHSERVVSEAKSNDLHRLLSYKESVLLSKHCCDTVYLAVVLEHKLFAEITRVSFHRDRSRFMNMVKQVSCFSPVIVETAMTRILRRCEPAIVKRLFPLTLSLMNLSSEATDDIAQLYHIRERKASLFQLFESSVSQSQLTLSARLLAPTIDVIGGGEDIVSSAAALCVSAMLLRASVSSLQTQTALECVCFMQRLEQVLDLHAFTLFSNVNRRQTTGDNSSHFATNLVTVFRNKFAFLRFKNGSVSPSVSATQLSPNGNNSGTFSSNSGSNVHNAPNNSGTNDWTTWLMSSIFGTTSNTTSNATSSSNTSSNTNNDAIFADNLSLHNITQHSETLLTQAVTQAVTQASSMLTLLQDSAEPCHRSSSRHTKTHSQSYFNKVRLFSLYHCVATHEDDTIDSLAIWQEWESFFETLSRLIPTDASDDATSETQEPFQHLNRWFQRRFAFPAVSSPNNLQLRHTPERIPRLSLCVLLLQFQSWLKVSDTRDTLKLGSFLLTVLSLFDFSKSVSRVSQSAEHSAINNEPTDTATQLMETHLRHSLPLLLRPFVDSFQSKTTVSDTDVSWSVAKQRIQTILMTIKFSKPFRYLMTLLHQLYSSAQGSVQGSEKSERRSKLMREEYAEKRQRWMTERVSVTTLRRLAVSESSGSSANKLYFELPERDTTLDVNNTSFPVKEVLRGVLCGLLATQDVFSASFLCVLLMEENEVEHEEVRHWKQFVVSQCVVTPVTGSTNRSETDVTEQSAEIMKRFYERHPPSLNVSPRHANDTEVLSLHQQVAQSLNVSPRHEGADSTKDTRHTLLNELEKTFLKCLFD